MPQNMHNNSKVMLWLDENTIEYDARKQLENMSKLPFIVDHIAVMPDCHVGKGATVGSVIPTEGAIIPAAVGVDLGCGMIAIETDMTAADLPESLREIRLNIERDIPSSAGQYNRELKGSAKFITRLRELDDTAKPLYETLSPNWRYQLGSLGGGNHFIELSLDENDNLWIVLHSGSRGIGNKIALHHIKIAQGLMEKYFINLPDRDLAYFTEKTPEFKEYIEDMLWAQEFARLNREEMMDRVIGIVSGKIRPFRELARINCHHNFAQQENHLGRNIWVTRKGAIQMQKGQWGIIPGSMASETYIVRGLGNKTAFDSAPHGAGRKYSRSKAKEIFTIADLGESLRGIEARVEVSLIDEIKGAYKDINEVIENSKDLVRVEHLLRQVVNVKGN